MALMLDEIEWADVPLFADPSVDDWNDTVQATLGRTPRVLRWVAPNPWLRSALLDVFRMPYQHTPERLRGIAIMVTSQENSCRYCYGVARAGLCSIGMEESVIREIERDTKLAGADDSERALIGFCRNLARSAPRPARAERDALEALGHDPRMIVELAFHVSIWCFVNRVATFLAVPLEPDSPSPKPGLVSRLIDRFAAGSAPSKAPPIPTDVVDDSGIDFGPLVQLLVGSSAAGALASSVRRSFESTVLSRRTKAMMIAVIAHTLRCDLCEGEARSLLSAEGMAAADIDELLSKLSLSELTDDERHLIRWTRETVHFETGPMQRQTADLMDTLGEEVTLEAIGVAALGNAMVRIGMLAQ